MLEMIDHDLYCYPLSFFSSLYLANTILASGQVQIKVLERGANWQCPSIERARKEIHQITKSTIFAMTGHVHTCTRMEAYCFYQHN